MVTKQEIQKTIDRLVGTKGNLNIPSWWMRKILSDLVKYCEDNELTSAIIKEYNKSQFNLVADKIEKLDTKLNNIGPHKLFEIVSELPVKPKDNIIYLVPSLKGEGNNVLTEWTWVNGSWEQFGEFGADVNLDDYATKEDLKSYATKDEVKPYDDSELKTAINKKVDSDNVATINGKSIINGGNIEIESGEKYDDSEIRTELDKKLEGKVVELAPTLPLEPLASLEIQRMLAGNTPNFIWEDIYGKIHFEKNEWKSRRAQNDATFRNTCRKVISATLATSGSEWAFLGGVQGSAQSDMGSVEEIYPYAFVNTANITSLNFAFSNMPNIKDWSFIKHMDTSQMTSMRGVFNNSNADEIDIGTWDVSNVTELGDPSYSFWGKTRKLIGLEKWNVSNVVNMRMLFGGYPLFTDVSGIVDWDVSNCENFSNLFIRHEKIETIDLSKWRIKDGANMSQMFFAVNILKTLGLPNIPTGANTSSMFASVKNLTTIHMRDDALIFPSVNFADAPLSAESVKVILSHLATTPDEGATITFKAGLYSGFSNEEKAEIDALRDSATANGWSIVNMS